MEIQATRVPYPIDDFAIFRAMHALLNRISINPEICGGRPCIKGTRVWVAMILDMLADNSSMDEILLDHPQLTREDILAALAYGAVISTQ